jgi:metal-sulfur cluster biosynthetic enzyme
MISQPPVILPASARRVVNLQPIADPSAGARNYPRLAMVYVAMTNNSSECPVTRKLRSTQREQLATNSGLANRKEFNELRFYSWHLLRCS